MAHVTKISPGESSGLLILRITKIVKEFGVSRKTFYRYRSRDKFRHRFEAEGVTGLEDRSRSPFKSPSLPGQGRIPQIVEEAIVQLHCQHPDFGPVRLQAELKNLGIEPPSHQGIQNVLVRHHLNGWNAPEKREYRRFERSSPNELWQSVSIKRLDTKGFLIIKDWGNIFPLDILDDYSRFCTACQPLPLERTEYSMNP